MSRATGRGGGSALPGLLVETLDPLGAARLAGQLPDGCVLVTGTNGKTTTSMMLTAMLRRAGKRVVSNPSGSNLGRGVVSSLVDSASVSGILDGDVGVFEVDELALGKVAQALRPTGIVVLNLFRDQLDRSGEVEAIARSVGAALASCPAVFLNGDDPLVAGLADQVSARTVVRYFGTGPAVGFAPSGTRIQDSDHCPVCGRPLVYRQVTFSHLGDYRCPEGHVERPRSDIALTSFTEAGPGGSLIRFETDGAAADLLLPLPGIANAYDALAAAGVATWLGLDLEAASSALADLGPAFGRGESVVYQERELTLVLVKNPVSFTQALGTFLTAEHGRPALFLVNDHLADGTDVSWLWDVAFEDVAAFAPRVTAGGTRAFDLAVRLRYAGIPADPVLDPKAALARAIEDIPPGGELLVFATYTAMLDLRLALARKQSLRAFWR